MAIREQYLEILAEEFDSDLVTDLKLYIINDGDLYRSRRYPIEKNLIKKIKKGIYDHTKAIKLWSYLVDDGAKKYTKEFYDKNTDWTKVIPKEVRNAVSKALAIEYYEKAKNGEYDYHLKEEFSGHKGLPFDIQEMFEEYLLFKEDNDYRNNKDDLRNWANEFAREYNLESPYKETDFYEETTEHTIETKSISEIIEDNPAKVNEFINKELLDMDSDLYNELYDYYHSKNEFSHDADGKKKYYELINDLFKEDLEFWLKND